MESQSTLRPSACRETFPAIPPYTARPEHVLRSLAGWIRGDQCAPRAVREDGVTVRYCPFDDSVLALVGCSDDEAGDCVLNTYACADGHVWVQDWRLDGSWVAS